MKKAPLAILFSALALLGPAAAAEVDFAREIKPLLEKACVQCHGPEKQKGALRLDSAEALRKGGDGGAAITPGKPEESEFFRRVTLPESDDEVMPPKGKEDHFTAAETELLKRWIAEGAPWPEGVVAVARSRDAAPMGPAPTAEEVSARAALGQYGLRVRPVASGVNWTRLSLRYAPVELPREVFSHLRRLQTLVELDLGATKVGEEELAVVAELASLAVLDLSQTAVSDAGLAKLGPLKKLARLSLYGTQITDAGLTKLATLPSLKQLAVAGTKVTGAGVASFRAARPGVLVEDGGMFTELARKEYFGPPKPEALTAEPTSKASAK